MNTMSLYESGDSSGVDSLKDICNNNITNHILEEISLEKLATCIVRGGWPENIDVSKNNVHLMPKSYMDNIINEDLNNFDDGVMYDKHKVELLLKSLARNESTTVSESSLLNDIIANDNESMSRNTINKYLEALSRLFIINNQPPFSSNLRSSLRVK